MKHCIKSWALLAPLAVAAGLRCLYVAKPDIGNDECFSLFYAQQSLPELIRGLASSDSPPLWEILLHFWIPLFGIGTVSLRALSVILSVATVVPIYLAGERFVGRHAGLAASLMYACSTFSIFLAHDGRVYSLIALLSAWSLYLFLVLANRQGNVRHWVWLAVVNVMLMYGHYLAFWVIAVEALIVILHKDTRKAMWRGGLLHLGVLLVCFIPMMPTLLARFLESGLHGTWIEKTTGIDRLYYMFCHLCNAPFVTVLVFCLMLAALVVAIVRRRSDSLRLTLFWSVPLLVSFALSFFLGFFHDRYFYFIFPAFYISLAAYAVAVAGKRTWLRYTLLAAMVLLMCVTVKPDSTRLRFGGWKGDTSAVVQRVQELTSSGGANVVLVPHWIDKQIVYYLDSAHAAFAREGRIEQPVFEPYLSQQGWFYDGGELNPQRDSVLLVHEQWWDIGYVEQSLIDQGYHHVGDERFQQLAISIFHR